MDKQSLFTGQQLLLKQAYLSGHWLFTHGPIPENKKRLIAKFVNCQIDHFKQLKVVKLLSIKI